MLSLMKTSEFEVIKQLRKMLAQISLFDLFKSLKKHKNVLMKILNEAQLEDFVGTNLLKDQIMFSDEDFSGEGCGHNKAIYISVRYKGMEISRVLIDNGFAPNLCPFSTLHRHRIRDEAIQPTKVTIRSFDGTKKDVVGDIELDIMVGPTLFVVNFQVVDVPRTFNLLLGRTWIHMVGAIPSSLHQKVKFVDNGKQVMVHEKMNFKAYEEESILFVEHEEGEEPNYYSLKMVSTVQVPAGSLIWITHLPSPTLMSGKVIL